MSHTTTINLEIKSISALRQACIDTTTPYRENADVQLYDGTVVSDCFAFKPKNWKFEVAAKNNELLFDNYNGVWGNMSELNKIKQRYAVNVQKETARARGYRVQEQSLSDGRVKLVIER